MKHPLRILETIFVRDFNLWVNEISTDQYNIEFEKLWGKTAHQIIIFNGRASEWCRFPDELENLKKYMTEKPLTSIFFSITEHKKFRQNNAKLRKLLTKPLKTIKNSSEHLSIITQLFTYNFSYNALGVFLPGSWKDEFLKNNTRQKKVARQIINRALQTRRQCEGIHKEVGDYMRKWLGPILESKGYPNNFAKLLTVNETKVFIEKGVLPNKKMLVRRSHGYIYFKNKLFVTENPKQFFLQKGIKLLEKIAPTSTSQIMGTIACAGAPVKGKVRIIMNSEEIKHFKKGEILVTSMTAPDYIQAMEKAAAIVTDEGGIISHAAIVSRELGVPCIIGTQIVTKALKDGDKVLVDANKGIIKKL